MANIDFENTDPRSENYDRLTHARSAYYNDEKAYEDSLHDEITSQGRFRPFDPSLSLPPEERFIYQPRIPPAFYGGEHPERGAPDVGILPLNTDRDPNAAYARYAKLAQRAANVDSTWKTIANMPMSNDEAPGQLGRRNAALDSLSQQFADLSNRALEHKNESLDLERDYNRQVQIQTLRSWDPEAHELASKAEQAQRDYGMAIRERSNLASRGAPIPRELGIRTQKAAAELDFHLGNWDAILEKKGFMGPKGSYLLSGVPAQFLDEASDKAMFNMKRSAQLQSEKIKMFQSRYTNDAPFRASVNTSLKAKVPGALAAGLGGYMVKQKMDEGESLPKAIATTAGDIVIGSAKYALWDRFVGPSTDLNQGEQAWLDKRDKVKFVQTLDKVKMEEMERDFPELRKEKSKVAREIKDRIEESKSVEYNIANSPLWNKQK